MFGTMFSNSENITRFFLMMSVTPEKAASPVDTEISKQILQIEQKLFKNPNWREADHFAIYKAWRS